MRRGIAFLLMMWEDNYMNNTFVTKTDPLTKRVTTAGVAFDGSVYRWTSNNRVPPADAAVEYGINRLPGFDAAAQDAARTAETSEFLREYRAAQKGLPVSAEERFEMRAAFGPGRTITNLITGRKVRT